MKLHLQHWVQKLRGVRAQYFAQTLGKGGGTPSCTQSEQTSLIVLSQFYKPEPVLFAPGIASSLSDGGNDVRVVTGYPNRPGGRLYEGYKQKFGFSEVIDGVQVYRTPLIVNHSRKSLERIANFLTFSFSAVTLGRKIRDADAVYVYATPATAAIPAQVWKKIFGIPYVLHIQDVWPESVTGSGMVGKGKAVKAIEFILNFWLKRLYRNAEKLIAISPGMRDLLIERGNDPEKCAVVYNWADETTISAKPDDSVVAGKIQFLYAGNLGPMQDLETVISAAKRLEKEENFSLKIAGGGILEESLRKTAEGSNRVSFLGRLPRSEVGDLYVESDFQLVTLKDIPIFRINVPSKLQASLAAGVPVITSVKGDVANLIVENGAGLVAEPEDIGSLVSVFHQAMNMSVEERREMGRNARRLYEEKMSFSSGTAAIASIMDNASKRKIS